MCQGYSFDILVLLSQLTFTDPSIEHDHEEEHVKKLFSTAVIVNEDTHWTFVRGH